MATPTPYPVSEADAERAATILAGAAGWTASQATSGARAYLLTGDGALAVVDGETGRAVLYAALAPDIVPPAGGLPAWSPPPAQRDRLDAAGAIALARSWAIAHGIAPDPSGAATALSVAGVGGWRVSLSDPAGEVEVRVVGRRVVGARISDAALPLRIPLVDRDAAIAIALDKTRAFTGRSDAALTSAEFMGQLADGRLLARWMVATGFPTAGPGGDEPVWELGIVGEVDAFSGELIIDKQG